MDTAAGANLDPAAVATTTEGERAPAGPTAGLGGPCDRGLAKRWLMAGADVPAGPFAAAAGRRPALIERLLAARRVAPSDRERYLKPSLGDIEVPWLRPDLRAAADVLLEAVSGGRRIVIYGDYDVDGITATAILWHTLKAIRPDADVRTYVPHRMDEGYGLNADAIDGFARDGVQLVVTVDCGVTAVGEAERARSLGIDLVVTDHHQPRDDGRRPDARVVVHPTAASEGGPHRFTEVCGAFVAWKLAWALLDRAAGSPEGHRLPAVHRELLTALLPLAAIGTVADVMPLVGENRVLVAMGVRLLRSTSLPGLASLLKLGDVGHVIDAETIAFRLAPRLNAAGRLGSAEAAVRLLTTAGPAECDAIVKELDTLNSERRAQERRIFDEAKALVREKGLDRDDRRAIVLASPDWHAGIVGIACARLVETFARPTILLQTIDDICKGSGRSIHGFSLVEAITGCGVPPIKAGGHAHAAGLTVARDRFDDFAAAFTAYATDRLAPDDLVPALHIDTVATLDELDHATVELCEHLAPFGRGNPRPTVRIDDLEVTAPPRLLGKDQRHLLIQLKDGRRSVWVKAKWWDARRHLEHFGPNSRVDVVAEPKIDRYLGNNVVELEIKDLRLRDSALS
jgi:single-stranded-DNA-specific exonuclease